MQRSLILNLNRKSRLDWTSNFGYNVDLDCTSVDSKFLKKYLQNSNRKISINLREKTNNNSNRAWFVKKTVEQLRSCAYDYSASIDDAISSFFLENSLGHDATIESVAFVLNVARVSDPLSLVSQRFCYFSFFLYEKSFKRMIFFKEIYIIIHE